jgi:hypothetical protein
MGNHDSYSDSFGEFPFIKICQDCQAFRELR